MKFSSLFKETSFNGTPTLKVTNFKAKTKQISFNNCMKSVNLELFLFTNFLMKKTPIVKIVKTHYHNLKNGVYDLNDEKRYAPTVVDVKNPYLKLKLTSIITKTRKMEVDKLPLIYKYKCKEMPEFQIYVANNLEENFEVLVLDVYHLLIPAPNKARGEKIEHSEEKYNSVKYANYDLSELTK